MSEQNGRKFEDLPKNLPENIGKEKNITSMSETSGSKGDVQSGIGIGLDAGFNGRERRRKPRSHGFLKAMIAYFCISFLLVGTVSVLAWRYAEIEERGSAEKFVEAYIAGKDNAAWQQQLRLNLPRTYPEYEDASRLAYEVLSPALNVGEITYLRRVKPSQEGYPVYEIFSDGRALASLVIKNTQSGFFTEKSWEAVRIDFKLSYFDNIDFPEYRIIVPTGAVLSVNGVAIDQGMAEKYLLEYPALSVTEKGHDVAPCDIYTFDDVYFVPELSATLDGEALELSEHGEKEWFFAYPESAMHSLTVTVPVGVDAYISGILLTEEWASREEIDGELGDLDNGGTGTLPRLSVWTVSGIFGEVEVSASIGEKPVELLSQENGDYKFDTPAECKYTVTVILPSGSALLVNGKEVDDSAKVEGGATAEEIAFGFTAFGKYEVSELGVIPGSVPAFDKYVLTGYLAQPNVTASLNGTPLKMAGMAVDGYFMRCEFDFSSGDAFDAERIAAAERFAETYIEYICDGGAWKNPTNEETFNANYNALKDMMIEGTAGYLAVMESYRDVNLLPKYDSFTVDSKNTTDLVAYTDISLSCKVEFSVTRTRTVDGAAQTDTLTGSISVLQVLYNGEWQVWSFVYVPTVVN